MNFFDRDITNSYYKCIEHIFLKLFFAYLVNLILTIWKRKEIFLAYHTGGNILSRGGGIINQKPLMVVAQMLAFLTSAQI